jgi:hypothetical protein
MKKILVTAITLGAAATFAQTYVAPHITKNGTYVEGHYRSNPNSTDLDNYSTKGNVNPYTGQAGTRTPSYEQPTYRQPTYTPPSNTYGTKCGYTASGQYVCR